MKQLCSISKVKFASLEEGLVPEARSASESKAWKKIARCVKVILYLLFVGLAGYVMWQTFSINMMEFKVINSIRESQSEGLLGQRSTFDKSARNGGQFHRSNDISTTEASVLDRKTSFTNETDDDELLDTPDVVTENYDIYEAYKEGVVGTTVSTDEVEGITFTPTITATTTVSPVESNSSLAQQMKERFYDNYDDDYLVNDEMKLERDQEEILENYALLSLIIQNAVGTSQIIDSFAHYDNSDNWGDSVSLSAQNDNGVEGVNSQGSQETQETQETLKLFINEGDDYEEESSENSDYQTVAGSTAKDYYGQFYRRHYGPWRIYV
ncbi:hypothetical protein QLX08_007276 [Tetragonisca angustula]|uniref:Uncharacterized protein n=1 Tax=Tetragonisca angustula TaxID=166442 RepID=A0AAW0ZQS8_9HYME